MPKIGILKEGKVPIDKRVALTPVQALWVVENYNQVSMICAPSNIRCFSDQDYENQQIKLSDKIDECDILLGVKEVPIDQLIENKTYLFFSHTIKKQSYNRDLLRAILKKKITLVDYETLTNSEGQRIIAFGRWAGIVGAYNALWTYGKRYNLFQIRRAHECFDLNDLKTEFIKISLPHIKFVITGGGRVAKGAMEVMNSLGIRKITAESFLNEQYDEPVFCQLNDGDYHKHAEGKEFDRSEFFDHPENFQSDFAPFTKEADVLIACAYWHPKAPVLFKPEDMAKKDFGIKVIADVTCDINGSIPSTLEATTIEDPIYDYDPAQRKMVTALSDEGNITVMAVDNLPCELPRNASEDFGNQLVKNVLPSLIGTDEDHVLERATIAKNGSLTSRFEYLQDYVDGH